MIEPHFTNNYDNTYTVSSACRNCKNVTSVTIRGEDLFRYRQGAHVQVAFPYLSAAQREALFISGICGDCWDDMFGDDE